MKALGVMVMVVGVLRRCSPLLGGCLGLRIPSTPTTILTAVAEAAAKSRQDIARECPRTIPVLIRAGL